MASVSASTLIIFIASILVAASVAGVMTGGVQEISSALGDRGGDVASDIRTDVDIISDTGSPSSICSDGTFTLYVKNTGSQPLSTDPDTLDILIGGQYHSDVQTSLLEEDQSWAVGDVLVVTVQNTGLDCASSHRIVLQVNDHRERLDYPGT